MRRGICKMCEKEGDCSIKNLTKHSINPNGHHLPPYIYICRRHHDKIHGIKQHSHQNKKFQKGTKKWKKK